MYLATGDRDAADTYSFGLLKSTDGGVTGHQQDCPTTSIRTIELVV